MRELTQFFLLKISCAALSTHLAALKISKVSDPNPSDPTVTRKWKASDPKLVTPVTRQLPEDRKLVTRTCYPSDPTATRKWKASDPNLVTPVTWQLPGKGIFISDLE